MKKLTLILVVIAVLLSGCVRDRTQQNDRLGLFERKVGLIAYVGLDGNVYTANQAGEAITQWTDDGTVEDETVNRLYQFPIWAADSQHLAFIQRDFDPVTSTTLDSAVYVVDTSDAENEPVVVYQSAVEEPSFISWSPDGTQLAVLANTLRGDNQSLRLIDIASGETRVVDTGNPLLFAWSPDGTMLLKHSGGSSPSSTLERLAFLDISRNPASESMLPQLPTSFGVPAWSADGEYVMLASVTDDNRKAVAIADAYGNTIMTLKNFSGEVAFSFSPDSRKAGILDRYYDSEGTPRGELTLIDLSEPEVYTVFEETNVLAFFWSPDSTKVAYFLFDQTSRASFFGLTPEEAEHYLQELEAAAATATAQSEEASADEEPADESSPSEGEATPDPEEGELVDMAEVIPVVSLRVYELGNRESFLILNFLRPSNSFMRVLLQFDLFNQAGTIWSPDSQNLVFSGAPTPDGLSLVLIAPANGRLLPRTISEGVLGFWSGE